MGAVRATAVLGYLVAALIRSLLTAMIKCCIGLGTFFTLKTTRFLFYKEPSSRPNSKSS